jgi:hypothetical protein
MNQGTEGLAGEPRPAPLRQWKYYRSRATHRRLLFSNEEIDRVERDGWWAKVVLKTGLTFKVTEFEPELIVTEKGRPVSQLTEEFDDFPRIP